MRRRAEIAVVGGGPSGLVAAIALATSAETVLFAPTAGPDPRSTALLDGSVRALEAFGVWPSLAPHAAPLRRLRIVDATRRLVRAPEMTFEAAELGLEAFGFNVENETLRRELRSAVECASRLRVIDAPAEEIQTSADGVSLRAGSQQEQVRLVVAADGRQSPCRSAAGIGARRRAFPQTALVLNLRHARPHYDVSTEFHTESGPFTLVPMPGNRSSLVWVVAPDDARSLLALDDAALAREIEQHAHSILGRMTIEGPRGSFPLAIEVAEHLAARRIALVGEAGHVLPPIGAQGLNLGIRDATAIAELAAEALRLGRDPGGSAVLEAYEARRRPDVRSRALAVEMMNRSLLTDFLPVQMARGFGFELAARFGFFRRMLMRQGLGPQHEAAPRLARDEVR